jgi:hypothetical protein
MPEPPAWQLLRKRQISKKLHVETQKSQNDKTAKRTNIPRTFSMRPHTLTGMRISSNG